MLEINQKICNIGNVTDDPAKQRPAPSHDEPVQAQASPTEIPYKLDGKNSLESIEESRLEKSLGSGSPKDALDEDETLTAVDRLRVEAEREKQGENGRFLHTFSLFKKVRFIDAFLRDPNISRAAALCGISPSAVRLHVRTDPIFRSALKEAMEAHCDTLESKVYQYAQDKSGVIDRMAWLRAKRPDVWNPERKLAISHQVSYEDADPEAKTKLINQSIDAELVEVLKDDK